MQEVFETKYRVYDAETDRFFGSDTLTPSICHPRFLISRTSVALGSNVIWSGDGIEAVNGRMILRDDGLFQLGDGSTITPCEVDDFRIMGPTFLVNRG